MSTSILKRGKYKAAAKGPKPRLSAKKNNSKLASRHQVSEEVFVRLKRPELRLSAQRITTLS